MQIRLFFYSIMVQPIEIFFMLRENFYKVVTRYKYKPSFPGVLVIYKGVYTRSEI
ncbi:MAG: hypothetical protein JWQ85_1083 [Mucilaginibacter sp.]|nr:hypothetical protein [Mucilaginibacter sp.]